MTPLVSGAGSDLVSDLVSNLASDLACGGGTAAVAAETPLLFRGQAARSRYARRVDFALAARGASASNANAVAADCAGVELSVIWTIM